MAEIIPAVLPKDFAELVDHVELMRGQVKTMQIDVCDGQFTPSATWPYRKHDDSYEKMMHEEEGLPGWEDLNFEIDLMANKPEDVVSDWVQVGANRVILHAEARGNLAEAIALLRDRVEIGMALDIHTPISILDPYKDQIQFVQCMGIDNVGFQGQDFDDKVIQKIREIKKAYPALFVSVDGGVSLETAPKLVEAGADRLVVGSAIFNADNAFEAIAELKRIAHRD